jgi:single-strand DNA-binding protein
LVYQKDIPVIECFLLERKLFMNLNKVMLTGRLGKDVELRVTPNGKSVATFSVASSRPIKDGDNWKEQTEWFRVVAWEKLADNCNRYLSKGSHCYVEGRLQSRDWVDKATGEKRRSTEVIASEVIFLDPARAKHEFDDSEEGEDESTF